MFILLKQHRLLRNRGPMKDVRACGYSLKKIDGQKNREKLWQDIFCSQIPMLFVGFRFIASLMENQKKYIAISTRTLSEKELRNMDISCWNSTEFLLKSRKRSSKSVKNKKHRNLCTKYDLP